MHSSSIPFDLLLFSCVVESFVYTNTYATQLPSMNESVFIRMCAWDQFSCVDFCRLMCAYCALNKFEKEIFTPVPFRLHRNPRYWNLKNTEKMNHKNVVIVCTMYRMTEFSSRKLNIMVIWWRQRRHYHHRHWCHYMIWSYRISVTRVTSHPIIWIYNKPPMCALVDWIDNANEMQKNNINVRICTVIRRDSHQSMHSKHSFSICVFTSRSNLTLICCSWLFHRRIGLLVFGWPLRALSTSFKSKESEKNTIHNNNNNHNKPLSSVLLTSFSVHSRRTSRIYSLIWVNNTKIDKNRHAIP